MLERTLVLVDTSYLLASFYNSWEEGARGQLEISLATVVHRLDQVAHGLVDQPVQRQNWYDGIPDSGPHRYQRTLRVIEGVQLRAGQLIEWGERRTQKAVDTLLVADMIQAAYKGQCSDMVLVTGDADMIPGVRVAVDAGVRMHLVGFGWDSISSALRHACDTTSVLDPRTDFHDAMQIRVLEGPIPPKVRSSAERPTAPGDDASEPVGEESVGMVEVDLRSDRASATSVADETSLTIADEEWAADAEERAADEQDCAAISEIHAADIDDAETAAGLTPANERGAKPGAGAGPAGKVRGSRPEPQPQSPH
ncbi:NYN domain-containing protein, partial [Dietzia sp. B19]|uniref:NYN domain-containing protein n=1 Tax=Dietzia sp. B19 TaxID=1630632 RepID=UPI001F507ED0